MVLSKVKYEHSKETLWELDPHTTAKHEILSC